MHFSTHSAPVHPRVSLNTLCLEPGTFPALVDTVARLGADAIFTERTDVETYGVAQSKRLLSDAGLPLAGLTHRAFGFSDPSEAARQRDRLHGTIEIAQAADCPAVCLTTGGRGDLSWSEAAARFAAEIAPCVEAAHAAGVLLGVEPTSHLYADASIAHRLSDLVALAERASTAIGLDIFPCWIDADLDEAIDRAAPLCAFVQLSDYVYGDRGLPCRAIPGDGAVPLDRIVARIVAAGYHGTFDLEVIGPRLGNDRHANLQRGLARVRASIDAALSAA